MELSITRKEFSDKSTIGDFHINGNVLCFTLEDRVREVEGVPVAEWKIKGQTAIPRGRYRMTIDMSTRFKRPMLHILDVPGFSGIRIHGGNTHENTEGCPLVGSFKEKDRIHGCAEVLGAIFNKVKAALSRGEEVWISIA